jgi:hypothetical protein
MAQDRDIDAATVDVPAWNPDDVPASLEGIYKYAEKQAGRATAWYYAKKRRKAFWSWTFRASTILLTALGGLIPIIVSTMDIDREKQWHLNQYGYIAIGLAGLALAFDRFTGSSTGWMRYISTAMAIETLLDEFRYDWVRLKAERWKSLDAAAITAFLDRVRIFALAIRSQVEKETQAWATEFQSSLAQLEKDTEQTYEAMREEARKQADAMDQARRAVTDGQRPGAINLAVKGNGVLQTGYRVELDGRLYRDGVTGATCGLVNIPPGLHELGVSAAQNGKALHVSTVVSVTAGTTIDATLDLSP